MLQCLRFLDDPEHGARRHGVARHDPRLEQAAALSKQGEKGPAVTAYRKALAASRDIPQGRAAAAGLLDLGVQVSVADHLGFLMDWYLVGPFDAHGMKGFTTPYPPEQKVDLKTAYAGKDGKVVKFWQSKMAPESPDLRAAIDAALAAG